MAGRRPHAVLLPLPGQGHINPMLQVAKLLHSRGFYVTFVHTRSSHRSILRSSGGPDALAGLEDFGYEVIPDGVAVPPTSRSSSKKKQQVSKGCVAYAASCSAPLREILARRGGGGGGPPGVTCVVYNWLMSFALDVAEELGIPALAFCTMSACGFLGSYFLEELIHKGYAPLKDEKYLTNGYLDTTIDWIPGMRGIRLRDLSSFIRTTDADDFFLETEATCTKKCDRAQGLILNTFDRLEAEVTEAIGAIFPKVYTLGPLPALLQANHAATDSPSVSTRFNYWEQERGCTEWLDAQSPGSVIYVSFGSLTTLTAEVLDEFAWGLADSGRPFLWVVRPDMVAGGGGNARPSVEDFVRRTCGGRGFVAGWCMQEEVLAHPSVGGFLTHGGWNSTLESVCAGVPVICWPGFAEQHTNCRYACEEWGVGVELGREVRREDVSRLVKELMGGEGGERLRKNAAKWKEEAQSAADVGGSSFDNLERLAKDLSSGKFQVGS
ncbi:7-deoxyloganetin glucosyltransferase-like [Iris pallida]|uniref:Glycosyltransferase n=1 Tax=Iris pallida TaxID=29817 RepID=A0AAX6FEC9_IRIPA|nr:7-deoxyloganetin glucosyltransferase-like [Iris pallida]